MDTVAEETAALLEPGADFEGERRTLERSPAGLPLTVHHPLQPSRGRVVLTPGWSGPRTGPAELLVELASALARDGWTAVRLDLPGRGDAPGAFLDCDLDAMINAVAAVCAMDTATPCVLVGVCSGGNVSLGSVTDPAARAAHCAGVVAVSTLPFQPSRTKTFEHRRRWRNLRQYLAKIFSWQSWRRLLKGEINLKRVGKNLSASEKPAAGSRNLKDSTRDIEKALLAWKGPALFVWGGGDDEAPPSRTHFEKLHASGMGTPGGVRFETVQGANHNFYGRAWRRTLVEHIRGFLNSLPIQSRGA